jgi:hypothetical protein
LPPEVRASSRYDGKDWWVDIIHLSVDGEWLRLRFEDGLTDYWTQKYGGVWVYTKDLPDWEKASDEPTITHDLGGEG